MLSLLLGVLLAASKFSLPPIFEDCSKKDAPGGGSTVSCVGSIKSPFDGIVQRASADCTFRKADQVAVCEGVAGSGSAQFGIYIVVVREGDQAYVVHAKYLKHVDREWAYRPLIYKTKYVGKTWGPPVTESEEEFASATRKYGLAGPSKDLEALLEREAVISNGTNR